MLSEKEAVENLKDFKSINVLYGNTFVMFLEQLKKYQESTETVLGIIDRLQKENEENKYLYQKALGDVVSADKENIELKKQIDLMAEYINYLSDELVRETGKNELKFCDMEICVENDIDCEDCIKQYFENKAKKGD